MRDKRVLSNERGPNGACRDCGRRHIHKDNCSVLKRREDLTPKLRCADLVDLAELAGHRPD